LSCVRRVKAFKNLVKIGEIDSNPPTAEAIDFDYGCFLVVALRLFGGASGAELIIFFQPSASGVSIGCEEGCCFWGKNWFANKIPKQ